MSDDRTLEPSPRKLREARERGMVPSSAELTAAVGVLAAVAALGASGGALADGIAGLMHGALAGDDLGLGDPGAFADRVRSALGAVAAPMAMLLIAPAAASLVAHQLQVGGLFLPALALPDPGRLRPGARGGSPADRIGRGLGVLARGALLLGLAWWTIRAVLREVEGIDPAASADLLRAAAVALHGALLRLGLALLAIGLAHYAMQVRRLHARLRMTPEEAREEQRSHDGDPALRSRRRAARDRRLAVNGASPASPAEPI